MKFGRAVRKPAALFPVALKIGAAPEMETSRIAEPCWWRLAETSVCGAEKRICYYLSFVRPHRNKPYEMPNVMLSRLKRKQFDVIIENISASASLR